MVAVNPTTPGHPISSGKLEGTNNLAKVIKRTACGFADDEYFFLKLLAAFQKTILHAAIPQIFALSQKKASSDYEDCQLWWLIKVQYLSTPTLADTPPCVNCAAGKNQQYRLEYRDLIVPTPQI